MAKFMGDLLGLAFDRLIEVRLTREVRDAVADRLIAWLSTETRTLPRADLPALIEGFSKRIRLMCDEFTVEEKDARLVVRVKGAHSDTLASLRRGSSWFEGTEHVEDLMVATVFQNIRRI